MPLKFKFFGGIQPRSRRVPKSDWEKHKEDIIREFRSKDLSHVIEWMARNRNFHASAKQFEHQLKRWGVKKYRKGGQANSDSLNHSPEQEKSQQVDGSSPSSVTQVADAGSSDNADAGAVYRPSSDTRGTDKATASVNGDERESRTGYISESAPTTCVSPEKSIDKRSPTSEGKLPTNSFGLHEIKAIQPQPSDSIDPGTSIAASPRSPTLGPAALSPGTRSFLKFAQRISRFKRGKPSAESFSIPVKKPRRASRSRRWFDEVRSVDSLSDDISSLSLDSVSGPFEMPKVVYVSEALEGEALESEALVRPPSRDYDNDALGPSWRMDVVRRVLGIEAVEMSHRTTDVNEALETMVPGDLRSVYTYRPLQPVAELPELER